jgi:hypothetical protein
MENTFNTSSQLILDSFDTLLKKLLDEELQVIKSMNQNDKAVASYVETK